MSSTLDKQISFRINNSIYNIIATAANKSSMTVSDYSRELIISSRIISDRSKAIGEQLCYMSSEFNELKAKYSTVDLSSIERRIEILWHILK